MSETVTEVHARLAQHQAALAGVHLRELFESDPNRFETFSLEAAGLLLDYSKQRITGETMALLMRLARAARVEPWRDEMLGGVAINVTERRRVLHTALRAPRDPGEPIGHQSVAGDVEAVLSRALAFAEGVRGGGIAAHDGRAFSDVVNLGIGGSDLGPAMTVAALRPYADGPRVHFVSNVDGAHLADTLSGLDPARTLVLVASKSFTTLETMMNAATARRWLVEALGEAAVGDHFAALSTNIPAVRAFGIREERAFGFWEWVGGRFSLWSAIGLPVMIAIGAQGFRDLLAGAHQMDRHFRSAPLEANMPVVMGLIGVWYRNHFGFDTQAIIPYDQRLARFAAFLQQVEMESNGKRTTREGSPVDTDTAAIVWGAPGTDGQHAFFQMLHQGTTIVPVDFLVAANAHEPAEWNAHHLALVANCLAQSEAFMRGQTLAEAEAALAAEGKPADEVARLAPHKVFPGNRPSSTLVYGRLDPKTLGSLIALYEHKTFVQGAVWGINSFDQWGVELGKTLATDVAPMLVDADARPDADASTRGLAAAIRRLRMR